MIRQAERYVKKHVGIDGVQMGYVEAGQGDPILFLHGNATSSYLWRNVMPYLESLGRCIAPDLIGMGDSDKLSESGPERYGFADQRGFLDKFLAALNVEERVTLVVHDWGTVLGFDWANRHRAAVKAVAYMEAIIDAPRLTDMNGALRETFEALRSPAGDAMVLEDNYLVEHFLPSMIMRELSDAEMAVYRRPYLTPGESRRPTLTWTREYPLAGEPAAVGDIIKNFMRWLPRSPMAKLFINGEPGAIAAVGDNRALCRSFVNQSEVTVRGLHYLPEDSPDEIGQAIADWLRIMG